MIKMAKLNKKKWISKGLTDKEMENMQCKHGSFTCGLHQKLKTGTLCNFCKKERGA